MRQYLDALKFILNHGEETLDRTGVGTLSVFGMEQRYDLSVGFPAVTTKKIAWKSFVSELIWFLEGSNDERRLAELLHGTRDPSKKTIWTANANADYWKPKAKFEGDLGRIYSTQWRDWRTLTTKRIAAWNEGDEVVVSRQGESVDQIKDLIEGIKKDPHGRRHILTAWNPGELSMMALPPCHILSQFHVSKSGKLSCKLTQRSADFPLGVPANIMSYSLLTHMIAQICGLQVGEFIHSIGNAHIYLNQIDGVREQITRVPMELPKLWLNPEIDDIDKFTVDDCKLIDYNHHPAIQFPFAV